MDKQEHVLNPGKRFRSILWIKTPKILFWIFVSLIWSITWTIIFQKFFQNQSNNDWFPIIIFLPWIIIIGWIRLLYAKVREDFWKQLALKYGWEYTQQKGFEDEKALLFKVGHSKQTSHGIRGDHNGQPLHIFEYAYEIGSKDKSIRFWFTVFEIKFLGSFPHLYLNYKKDWYSNTPMADSLAEIPVPPEFTKKFKFYAPKEYEIETLEIFTPDIFALLLDLGWNHDMEFVDGELIIYQKKMLSSFEELDTELNKIKKFIEVLSPLLNRFKLTQIGNISPLLKT